MPVRMNSMHTAVLSVAMAVSGVIGTSGCEDGQTLAAVHPGLVSGGLTFAKLGQLPHAVLLKLEGVVITQQDIETGLRKNPPFPMENIVTRSLLARTQATLDGASVSGKT